MDKQTKARNILMPRRIVVFSLLLITLTIVIAGMIVFLVGTLWIVKNYGVLGGDFGFWDRVDIGTHEGKLISALILIVIFLVILYKAFIKGVKLDSRNIIDGKTDTAGSSRFLNDQEMREIYEVGPARKLKGTILAQLDGECIAINPKTDRNKNVLVVGAPGCKKSRAYVRPAVLQAEKRGESIVVTSTKGSEYRILAKYMRKKGYLVKVFNLVNLDASDAWDVLGEIEADLEKASIFAEVVLENLGFVKSKPEFWMIAAKNVLKALALIVAVDEDMQKSGQQTIGSVYTLLSESGDQEAFEKRFQTTVLNNRHHVAHAAWSIYCNASEKVRADVRHELSIFLEIFQNDVVKAITGHDEINLTLPAVTKCCYFVIISDQHKTYSLLSGLFFSFLFIDIIGLADKEKSETCPIPVNIIIDEFPQLGRITDYIGKLATVRSRNVYVSTIIQNMGQIIGMYPGKEYEGIISCCDYQLFLGGNDETTAKHISQRAGIAGVTQHTTRISRSALSPVHIPRDYALSESEVRRNLINVDEVYTMPMDEAIVITRSAHVLKAKKFDYSEHPQYKHLEEESTIDHIPEWRKSNWEQTISETEKKLIKINEIPPTQRTEPNQGAPKGVPVTNRSRKVKKTGASQIMEGEQEIMNIMDPPVSAGEEISDPSEIPYSPEPYPDFEPQQAREEPDPEQELVWEQHTVEEHPPKPEELPPILEDPLPIPEGEPDITVLPEPIQIVPVSAFPNDVETEYDDIDQISDQMRDRLAKGPFQRSPPYIDPVQKVAPTPKPQKRTSELDDMDLSSIFSANALKGKTTQNPGRKR